MVDTAIIYCNDGILIYRPHKEPKYQEILGSNNITLNWSRGNIKQAKHDLERLKE